MEFTNKTKIMDNTIQVIKCKCGKVFAACREPECYTEKEWTNDLRKYVLDGCTVEIVQGGTFEFEKCVCNKLDEVKKETEDSNQVKLFN